MSTPDRKRCPGRHVPERDSSSEALPRLVVVDDSRDFRTILRIALTGSGFEVVAEACGGRLGLDAVRRHEPDVVVTDLQMPDADGLWLIERLREEGAEIPVVLLTGVPGPDTRERALAVGASLVLEKRAGCLPQLTATLREFHLGDEQTGAQVEQA